MTTKKTAKPKISAAEKKLIIAFSEHSGITDKLPIRVIKHKGKFRWFVVLWPLDEAYGKGEFTEAWFVGYDGIFECMGDVPKKIADAVWRKGEPTDELKTLLVKWESEP
jgi:hypothetical protein